MNIGLIGYGKMGKMVEAAALSRGHNITLVIDPFAPEEKAAREVPISRSFPPAGEANSARTSSAGKTSGAQAASGVEATFPDVFIEFTRPETAPDNIKAAAALGAPVVCGSTGWYNLLPEITAAVEKAGAALLWSSNFSLGVNLFYRVAEYAARLADPFAEYDLGGLEVHHRKKADSPSGTAKTLMERVLAAMKRKTKVLWNLPGGGADGANADGAALPEDAVHFTSLRNGSVPGTHSLFFDSPADTIEITHTARSREGFASGAVVAAEWLKTRRGVFTMEDALKDILP